MKSLLKAFQERMFGLLARLVRSPGLEPVIVGALAFPLAACFVDSAATPDRKQPFALPRVHCVGAAAPEAVPRLRRHRRPTSGVSSAFSPAMAAAIRLPMASDAARTGSSERWAYRCVVATWV